MLRPQTHATNRLYWNASPTNPCNQPIVLECFAHKPMTLMRLYWNASPMKPMQPTAIALIKEDYKKHTLESNKTRGQGEAFQHNTFLL
ncbi:MAG: hypothetical protein F6J93_12665 [Oscillatoria sp. SIO1A7]|nr:hypothetical protein [Oscillatoria sp. SIO1A7]